MIKRYLLFTVMMVCALNIFAQRKAEDRPNIILINIDDMGYGDTEPYGMTGISTPNFNRLAKEGVRLTHFNAAQAVCSPSRAALLTGCYPNRLGIHHALMPWTEIALNPNEETIASLLKKRAYKTAMLGKWHLGSKAPFLPIHFGFDTYYGAPYSHDMWPVDYDGKPAAPNNYISKYPPLPILEGDKQVGTVKNLDEQGQWTSVLTKKAVAFIRENKAQPFFLYLAHPMPHVPLAASQKFKGKSELGLFGDVIMELDWSVGEILNVLDREGLSKNTLLILTSDNGPWLTFGDHAGSSGGFREGKGTAWDGGTRVPCFVRWPGKVEAGGVKSQLMTNMDLLPVICAATGAPLPQKKIDGLNFLPLLLGKEAKGPREVFYYYYDINSLKAVRYKNWKLVLPHSSQSYVQGKPGKDGKPGSTPVVNIKMALYDLAHDPGETRDVQSLYPEMVQRIMQYVEEARKDLGDDLTGKTGENVREAGKL